MCADRSLNRIERPRDGRLLERGHAAKRLRARFIAFLALVNHHFLPGNSPWTATARKFSLDRYTATAGKLSLDRYTSKPKTRDPFTRRVITVIPRGVPHRKRVEL